MSLGEIEGEKTSSLYTTVNAGLAALLGKDFVVTPESSKKVYDLASSYIAMGDSIAVAVQKAIELLSKSNQIPEFKESQKYQADVRKALLDKEAQALRVAQEQIRASKVSTGIAERQMTVAEKKQEAEAEKAKADAKNPWQVTGAINDDGYILMYNKDTGAMEYRQPQVVKSPQEWKATTGIDLLDAPDGTKIPTVLKDTTQ